MAGLINLRLLTDFFNKIDPKRKPGRANTSAAWSPGVWTLENRTAAFT